MEDSPSHGLQTRLRVALWHRQRGDVSQEGRPRRLEPREVTDDVLGAGTFLGFAQGRGRRSEEAPG